MFGASYKKTWIWPAEQVRASINYYYDVMHTVDSDSADEEMSYAAVDTMSG